MKKEKESGWSIFTDIIMATIYMLAIGIVISFILWFFTVDASADEWFPDAPIMWIGAEYDFSDPVSVCHQDGAGWNGNVGIRQGIYETGPVRFNGVFQHHSCAFSSDAVDYNAVGVNFELDFAKLNWW